MVCPCHDCPYRKLTCHDSCEEYMTYHDALVDAKRKVREAQDAVNYLYDMARRRDRAARTERRR